MTSNDIAEDAPATAAAFKGTGVVAVDLSYNYIAEDTPSTIASFKGTGITKVILAGNIIAEYASSTAAAFTGTEVIIVDLSYNQIAQNAPATAAAFKDTGVIAVSLENNGTTLETDLKCLDIIWNQGQVCKLALDHKKECANLMKECIEAILYTEFTNKGALGEKLLFPDDVQNLIEAYATIEMDW